MGDLAIKVEGISKLYHIGAKQQRHDTLRDMIAAKFSRQTGDGRPVLGLQLEFII